MALLSASEKPPTESTLLPTGSQFTQQELPAIRLLLTPNRLILLGFLVGCAFVPIGAVCLLAAFSVVEVPLRYDDVCIAGSSNSVKEDNLQQLNGVGSVCVVAITVPKAMKAPVFLYYGLDNYQQNHRRYVKSRSDKQMRGVQDTKARTDCSPQYNLDGNASLVIRPCGLPAWSYFNDTFQVTIAGGSQVPIDETGIAWRQDLQHKDAALPAENFNSDPALRGGATITGNLNQDEHFAVWMRPATMPNFRKLWGRIGQDLAAGTVLNITVTNRYNTYRFGGKKHIILSTASWLGGRTDFLGIAYLTVGGASLACSLVVLLLQLVFARKLGDLTQLSWK